MRRKYGRTVYISEVDRDIGLQWPPHQQVPAGHAQSCPVLQYDRSMCTGLPQLNPVGRPDELMQRSARGCSLDLEVAHSHTDILSSLLVLYKRSPGTRPQLMVTSIFILSLWTIFSSLFQQPPPMRRIVQFWTAAQGRECDVTVLIILIHSCRPPSRYM